MSDPPRLVRSDLLPTLTIDPVTQAAAGRVRRTNHCGCLATRGKKGTPGVPRLHVDEQDFGAPGWSHTLDLVRAGVADGVEIFEPSAHMPWDDWMRVVTLPEEISDLKTVQQIRLYGSHLRRLPPQIGRMVALQDLDIYTSYSLHWLPFEVLRCSQLSKTRMSTRTLYGNRKTRLPFPRLSGPVEALMPPSCSVCDRPFGDIAPQLYWVTLRVGTDMAPLLIHSCSSDCTQSVPTPPANYFARPHKGGAGVGMPEEWDPSRGILWPDDVVMKL
jgi:hypothetical protein